MKYLALAAFLIVIQDPGVDRLLGDLSDPSVTTREAAMKALVALGDKAEDAVRSHAEKADPETKARCQEILKKIEFGKKVAKAVPAPRRVTLKAQGRSVKDVLKELAETIGMPADLDSIPDVRLQKDLNDLSMWEALDALGKAADVDLYFGESRSWDARSGETVDSTPKLRFEKGYADSPRAYHGHYRISVESVLVTRELKFKGPATGECRLMFRVAWFPPLKPEGDFTLRVSSAIDSKGGERYSYIPKDPDEATVVALNTESLSCDVDDGCMIDLDKEPLESLASVKGTVILRYPIERNRLVIDNPKAAVGETRESGRLKVKVREYKEEKGEVHLVVDVSGPGIESVDLSDLRILTDNGSFLEGTHSCLSGPVNNDLKTYEKSYRLGDSKVKALEFVSETVWHKDKFEFELKDIPVPK